MKLSKRLGALLLVVCLMLTLIPAAFAAPATGAITLTINQPTMSVNGVSKTIDAQGSRAVLYQGNTMLPIAAVIGNMGGSAAWNASTREVTLKYNGQTVVLTLGSKYARVNGVNKSMPVAPYTDNGRTYVWLRTLEFFPGVTVNWRADVRQATVVYPMNSSSTPGVGSVSLTIKNGADLAFGSMQLAPAGTANWGQNLLSSTLNWNETRTVNASVGQARYDLRARDIYGNYFYYYNLDFTGVKSVAVLSLTSGAQYSLTLDGIIATGADSNVNLNIWNKTGSTIISMAYGPANSGVWSNELLSGVTINNGTVRNFNLAYASKSPYYDFRVTYSNGAVQIFPAVNLASTFGTQIITLNPAGNVTYGNTGSAVSGNTEITFRNNSGYRIDELYMSTSDTSSAWRGAEDLLDGTVSNGKSDDFKIDLGYSKKWYVRAYDRDGDLYSGYVTFSSTSVKSATLTLDRDGDFSLSRQGSGSSDGDIRLVISNTSGKDIYGIFAVDPDEKISRWDYDDFNDEYDDLGDLDDGEVDYFDVDLYDDEYVTLVFFENDDDDFTEAKVRFRRADDYGYVSVYDYTSGSFDVSYDDDDSLSSDEIFLEFYNSTNKRITEIEYKPEDSSSGKYETLSDRTISNSEVFSFDVEDTSGSWDDDDVDGYWDFRVTYDNDKTVEFTCNLNNVDFFAQILCASNSSDCGVEFDH